VLPNSTTSLFAIVCTNGRHEVTVLLKRTFDYCVSAFLLIVLAPLFAIIAIAIKLDSEGPVFFVQERLGKDGKVFRLYKFRTMIHGSEKSGSGLHTYADDPRITRVGKILRRTSLDELPQLINVLKGEMSIIGPRPPVPYHPKPYECYTEEERLRFSVLPGITGYAQVMGRNELTWDERIALDVEYVRNFSIWLDAKILLMTIATILSGTGLY